MPPNRYCFDTNALIDGWKNYPISAFPKLWANLERMIRDETAFSSIEVKRELAQWHGGPLVTWVKQQDGFFRQSTRQVQNIVAKITDTTDLVDEEAQKSTADPFVIALAKVEGARVVTHEGRAGPRQRVKVPDVCMKLAVQYTRFVGVITSEGWVFK